MTLKDFFSNKKNRILLFIFFLFILYIILFSSARKAEVLSTFPALKLENNNTSSIKTLPENFQEINVKDKNGDNINGIYLPAKEQTKKTVYFFHGNSGDLSYFYNWITYINNLGYNVISYDYPGYGKSTGYPDLETLKSFSNTFYNYVDLEKDIDEKELIIWGYSIGTALAMDFASENEFDKIILDSPLSSRYDMSRYYMGFALQKVFFIPNTFVNSDLVKNISNDLLIIHGNIDKIVPFYQGEKIFDNSISKNKFLVEIDSKGHTQTIENYGKSLKYIISGFLNEKNNRYFSSGYLLIDNKNKEKLENEMWIDLEKDDSIQKFVTSNLSFNDKSYIPSNLVSIYSNFVFDAKGGNQLLRQEANESLQKLAKDFYDEFGIKLKVVSAYRSYNYQKGIKDRGCPDNLCAKAGFSEHQSGLSIDIFEASTNYNWKNNNNLKKYYSWLDLNAHKFGFHNTYQKGLKIDGYEIEPWHWRYLGEELSTYLKEKNITIAEFYNKKNMD